MAFPGTILPERPTALAIVWMCALTILQAGGQDESHLLMEATRNQNVDVLRVLLSEPVDVNLKQPDGSAPLHWAVHRENLTIAGLLINAGADTNAANDLAVTPLLMASRRGHGPLVKQLLAAGADPNLSLDSGETPLMAASRAGSLEAVDALLVSGADVNMTENTRGQSALMWAAANSHPNITRSLLAHGADVHARSVTRRRVFNMGGNRSAGSASRGISLEQVELGGSSPLLFAARSGDLISARLLLGAGADLNDRAADGNTPLLIATHSGHGSLAEFLLETGADPNDSPLGYTALHAAVLRGNLRDRRVLNVDPGVGAPLVLALMAHGADPNVQLTAGSPVRRWSHDFAFMARWSGATPFWLAAKFLEVDMMRVLVEGGGDPTLPSDDGTTPLMVAAGLGYNRGGGSAFIKDRRDFSSYNPVASAAEGSRIPASEERLALDAVELALELGAEANATNDAGDTALHAAATHGMDTVIRFLTDHGGDVSAVNRRGQAPSALAVYSDGIAGDRFIRPSTVELLRSLGNPEVTHPGQPHIHLEYQSFTNPLPDTPNSVAAGRATYARVCGTCHGLTGRGDGRLAAATAAYGTPPSDLTDPIWQHGGSDGEIFVAIRDGISPTFAMDSFGARLTDTDIWNLVNYLKRIR